MTKPELVKNVATVAGITQKEAGLAVTEVFDSIRASLLSGDKTVIAGFGAFSVKDIPARKGHNPQTGKVLEIAPHRKISFKVAADLKQAVK